MQARWMDNSTGRFISIDPIQDGYNWYAYCEGNPVTYTDPTGLFPAGYETTTPATTPATPVQTPVQTPVTPATPIQTPTTPLPTGPGLFDRARDGVNNFIDRLKGSIGPFKSGKSGDDGPENPYVDRSGSTHGISSQEARERAIQESVRKFEDQLRKKQSAGNVNVADKTVLEPEREPFRYPANDRELFQFHLDHDAVDRAIQLTIDQTMDDPWGSTIGALKGGGNALYDLVDSTLDITLVFLGDSKTSKKMGDGLIATGKALKDGVSDFIAEPQGTLNSLTDVMNDAIYDYIDSSIEDKWEDIGYVAADLIVLEAVLDKVMLGKIDNLADAGKTGKVATKLDDIDDVAKAGKNVDKIARCFVAGTLTLTATGSVPIEDIKAGDFVLAKNVQTGEVGYKEVVRTFVRETDTIYRLYTENEEIETTDEHPIWVVGRGFVVAKELKAGDTLELANGRTVKLVRVEIAFHEQPVAVYNFEVADWHTYYVGKDSLLVHNADCTKKIRAWIKKDTYQEIIKAKGRKNAQQFGSIMKKAMEKGKFAASEGEQGIKVINAAHKNGKFYKFELKTRGKEMGDFRLFGNYDSNGNIVFDLFSRGLHKKK